MRILTYTVTEADAGRAVRSVVPRRFCLGQHAFRRLKVLGAIRVGGVPVRADYRLHAGEVIEVHLPSDMAQQSAAHEAAVPGLPPSFLRYQDEDLLIVSKGAPLPTLPARHIATGTLREQVMAMLHADPETFVYHPVNRLDKGTSGLLCIARLGTGARRAVRSDGQRAVTHYRVERVSGNRALVRLRLETGRTHQIRVHLAHIGCPIAGDYLYGTALDALPGRFALHSASIRLTQPITGETIALDEPLPEGLERLMAAHDLT